MATTQRIPLGPFQEAFHRQGLTAYELAARMGWYCTKASRPSYGAHPDSSRVRRTLGLSVREGLHQKGITEGVAKQLARGLNLDPVDLGF